jgi:phage baseplate assembly protein W
MTTISFKSSGKTREDRLAQALIQSPTAVGIVTPLRLGSDEIFLTNFNLATQVADNLRNLVLTNWGERLCLYDYGANLRPLTTEFSTQDNFDAQAVERISGAVQRWMPFITLETFESRIDRINNKNTAIIKLMITYNIPSLNVFKKTLEVTLYAI